MLSEVLGGTGHLDVETGGERRGRMCAPPVGYDDSVETPLLAEQLCEQPTVLGAVGAPETVVGRHDRPGAGETHRILEGTQVELAQRSFGYLRRDVVTFGLLVVGHEVLDAGTDPVGLQFADVCHRQCSGQGRILRHALEVATGQRMAMEVDRGSEQHVSSLADRLGRQHSSHLAEHVDIPGRSQRGSTGHAGRGAGEPPCAARPGRSVAHGQSTQSELLHPGCVPHVDSCGSGDEVPRSNPSRRSAALRVRSLRGLVVR